MRSYDAALCRVGLEPGQCILDVGCGTGAFLRLAARRGAHACGLEASAALAAAARRRVPGADVRMGAPAALPWPDDSLDLVLGFQSFFLGGDTAALLHEAARVARPGASVVVQVPGPRERCDLEAVRILARPVMAARPLQPELWRDGALEALAARAGLTPECAFDTSWAYEFPDAATAGRALLATAGVAGARSAAVRATVVAGLERFRTAAGGYQLFNAYRYLVARAA